MLLVLVKRQRLGGAIINNQSQFLGISTAYIQVGMFIQPLVGVWSLVGIYVIGVVAAPMIDVLFTNTNWFDC